MDDKQREFNAAMAAYEARPVYRWTGRVVSVVNVSLQLALLVALFRTSPGLVRHLFAGALAFVLADFVSGLVHMIMDNSARYASRVGPLIAAFHLHHKTPRYKRNHLAAVYFNESGSKIWLAVLLVVVGVVHGLAPLPPFVLALLTYFCILSSVAEVSHYLCHVSPQQPSWLARAGIFLSWKHHRHHHADDNRNYAFLNGMTDPILNLVAALFFSGYKHGTDLHHAHYSGAGTANRPS